MTRDEAIVAAPADGQVWECGGFLRIEETAWSCYLADGLDWEEWGFHGFSADTLEMLDYKRVTA